MKPLAEKIHWFKSPEIRRWKRLIQCAELLFFSLSASFVLLLVIRYGDGTKLQSVLLFFTVVNAIPALCLLPAFYSERTLNRWQRLFITSGLGCGAALSIIATLFMFELQANG